MTPIMTQPVIANKAVFNAEALGNKKRYLFQLIHLLDKKLI